MQRHWGNGHHGVVPKNVRVEQEPDARGKTRSVLVCEPHGERQMGDRVRGRTRTLIEHGPPVLMLCRYVEEQHADLTVIGAYGRGFLFHWPAGGYTPRIVDSVPSDVFLVRAHRAEAPAHA